MSSLASGRPAGNPHEVPSWLISTSRSPPATPDASSPCERPAGGSPGGCQETNQSLATRRRWHRFTIPGRDTPRHAAPLSESCLHSTPRRSWSAHWAAAPARESRTTPGHRGLHASERCAGRRFAQTSEHPAAYPGVGPVAATPVQFDPSAADVMASRESLTDRNVLARVAPAR
jgi:hypothetical protein